MSLRLRITALFVVIFGATFLVFAFLVFRTTLRSAEKSFDDALYNYAVDVFDKISLGPEGNLSVETPFLDREKIYPFPLGTALIRVRNTEGQIISEVGDFGDFDLPFQNDRLRILAGNRFSFRTLENLGDLPNQEAQSYRMLTVPIDNSPIPVLYLQIAVPRTVLEAQSDETLFLLSLLIPLSLLVATLGGYFLSARALRPVHAMTSQVRHFSPADLTQRVSVPVAKDELRALALTMNDLLERIQRAFQSQERFIADASHQLQTPLALIRAEIESEQIQKHLHASATRSVLQEVDHMSRLIKDLLLLARAEAGGGALNMQAFFLDELVLETLSRLDTLARKRNIRLLCNIEENHLPRKSLRGDPELITTLIFSLLENAVKYSPSDSSVSVKVQWKKDREALVVADEGTGVPETEFEQVFERFHRGHPANSEGHGLGLAIAKKVADAHQARLWVEKAQPHGAAFHFEMRYADSAAQEVSQQIKIF